MRRIFATPSPCLDSCTGDRHQYCLCSIFSVLQRFKCQVALRQWFNTKIATDGSPERCVAISKMRGTVGLGGNSNDALEFFHKRREMAAIGKKFERIMFVVVLPTLSPFPWIGVVHA